jgi:HD-like signal output (HDOD) protein
LTAQRKPEAYLGDSPDFNLRFSPLPKTQAVVAQLARAGAEMPDTPRLADVVRADPIIAAFILRRINSVFHGVRRAVDDVRQAVRLLGFQEVCDIVLTVGKTEEEPVVFSGKQAAIFRDIMKVSIGAAFFTEKLAEQLCLPQKNIAFTVGLQHAVGRLVLLQNRPREYELLWEGIVGEFGPRAGDERRVFGADHAELGARALSRWNYPETITAIIRNYARPGALADQSLRAMALTLSVAVTASEQLCLSMVSRRGKRFFTPTPATHALARLTKMSSMVLVEKIRPHREPARDFMMEMLRG